MATQSKLVRDDDYEEIAAAFRCIQVSVLNEALKECGISDERMRRDVCKKYAFNMGNFHDQYWFKVNDKRVFPLLCFSEEFLNTDTDIANLGTIFAPSTCFAFHEYAGGAIEWCFEEHNEDASEIVTGLVGEEEN